MSKDIKDIVLICCTALVIAAGWLFIHETRMPDVQAFRHEDSRHQLEDMEKMAGKDPAAAWAFLALANDQGPGFNGHGLGHLVGKALYKKYGFEGMRYCTTTLSFSCYHGISLAAINEQGGGVLDNLIAKCEAYFPTSASGKGVGFTRACIHGLGHGVASSEALDVSRGLARCMTVPEGNRYVDKALSIYTDNRIACAEGMFMEIALDQKTVDFSEYCKSVPTEYQMACMQYAPLQSVREGTLHDLPGLIAFCSKAATALLQKGCLNESAVSDLMGKSTGQNDEYEKAISDCDALHTDLEYHAWCVSVIASTAILDNQLKQRGTGKTDPTALATLMKRICTTLQGPDQERCSARGKLLAILYSTFGS